MAKCRLIAHFARLGISLLAWMRREKQFPRRDSTGSGCSISGFERGVGRSTFCRENGNNACAVASGFNLQISPQLPDSLPHALDAHSDPGGRHGHSFPLVSNLDLNTPSIVSNADAGRAALGM